jgi:hypothetical protein
VGVVEQRVNSLDALKIDEAHHLAFPNFEQKGVTCLYHKAVQSVFRQQLTGLQN